MNRRCLVDAAHPLVMFEAAVALRDAQVALNAARVLCRHTARLLDQIT